MLYKFVLLEKRNSDNNEALENRQNNESAQRDRYYATIHKVVLQSDKIPGKPLDKINSLFQDRSKTCATC